MSSGKVIIVNKGKQNHFRSENNPDLRKVVNLQLCFTDPLEYLPITNKKSEIVRSERSLLIRIRIHILMRSISLGMSFSCLTLRFHYCEETY